MNDILCIVVTYNRLSDLKLCYEALQRQTMKRFDILVVNNGSTDGTSEFLNEKSKEIIVINQENLGGAGGFYAGMKYGLEHNYKWLWLMDDDGIPEEHQLERLYSQREVSMYLNALVLNKDNHEEFAFQPDDKRITLEKICQNNPSNILIHPFNGTFFNIEMVKQIGLIKKEMFIWGDEKEYTFRAMAHGIAPVTITNAIHYHPKEKGIKQYAIPFIHYRKTIILIKPSKLSHYYYRNLGYIDKTYRGALKSLKQVAIHAIFFIRKGEWKELSKFIKFYLNGRNNKYN